MRVLLHASRACSNIRDIVFKYYALCREYFEHKRLGSAMQVFRLSFGPKSFVVVSDAEVARHLLMSNAANYSKGILSEILDFVMGSGARCLPPFAFKD